MSAIAPPDSPRELSRPLAIMPAGTPEPDVHPDFAGPADTALVAADGTEFHIASSDLARCSGWFRTLFSVPQGEDESKPAAARGTTSIFVSEDARTLGILLKLACAIPPGLGSVRNLNEVEILLRAADKYEMASATEVLLLLLHTPRMQTDALHLYGLAGRYGQDDIADGALKRLLEMRIDFATAAHMDGAQMGRLVALRQERVERFCRLLGKTGLDLPFTCENEGWCYHCKFRAQEKAPGVSTQSTWLSFVIALQNAFVAHPSVAALEEDARVKTLISELGFKICANDSCGRLLYDWPSIRTRLSAIFERPTSL